jgi:hypothetical protein
MNKIFSLLLLLTVSYGIAQPLHVNDPNAQQRKIGSFSAIHISGGIDLYLTQENEEALYVSASESEYTADIKSEVKNGELKIWYAPVNKNRKAGNRKLKAYVSFKDISSIKASGSCDVVVSGQVDLDKLHIGISGESEFKGELRVHRLTINQSGASDATLSGKVNDLAVFATGGSDMEAFKLETEKCNAKAFGASDIRITVNKELSAVANGSSSIYYRGGAVVRDVKVMGASSVNKKG